MSGRIEPVVDHYLAEWGGARWAQAFHALIEMGAPALPVLADRFQAARDPSLRAGIVEIVRHQRNPEAIPFFESALADPSPQVWKAALDGLVALATPDALRVLEASLVWEPTSPDFKSWVEEALEQVREAVENEHTRGGQR